MSDLYLNYSGHSYPLLSLIKKYPTTSALCTYLSTLLGNTIIGVSSKKIVYPISYVIENKGDLLNMTFYPIFTFEKKQGNNNSSNNNNDINNSNDNRPLTSYGNRKHSIESTLVNNYKQSIELKPIKINVLLANGKSCYLLLDRNALDNILYLRNILFNDDNNDNLNISKLIDSFDIISNKGYINRDSFLNLISNISNKFDIFEDEERVLIEDSLFRLFDCFDSNGDGNVSFNEFVTGISILSNAPSAEKLRLTFDLFDMDGNGYIVREELFKYFRSYLLALIAFSDESNDQPGVPFGHLMEAIDFAADDAAEICFVNSDINHDGVITFEEFEKCFDKFHDLVPWFSLIDGRINKTERCELCANWPCRLNSKQNRSSVQSRQSIQSSLGVNKRDSVQSNQSTEFSQYGNKRGSFQSVQSALSAEDNETEKMLNKLQGLYNSYLQIKDELETAKSLVDLKKKQIYQLTSNNEQYDTEEESEYKDADSDEDAVNEFRRSSVASVADSTNMAAIGEDDYRRIRKVKDEEGEIEGHLNNSTAIGEEDYERLCKIREEEKNNEEMNKSNSKDIDSEEDSEDDSFINNDDGSSDTEGDIVTSDKLSVDSSIPTIVFDLDDEGESYQFDAEELVSIVALRHVFARSLTLSNLVKSLDENTSEDGTLTNSAIQKCLLSILPKDLNPEDSTQVVYALDTIFSAFLQLSQEEEENKDNSSALIEAAEFLSSLVMLTDADMDKKVALLFTLCDSDSDGFIKPVSLFVLMRSLAITLLSLNTNSEKWPVALIIEMAARAGRTATLQCFDSTDAALTGLLSFSDFRNWFCNSQKSPQTIWVHIFDDL